MADFSLQLQADNLPINVIEPLLVEGQWKPIMDRMMTAENILIEGCRGVGKTMLMRAAVLRLEKRYSDGQKILGVHATFKRYLATLPPPSSSEAGGAELANFRAWINARILSAVQSTVRDVKGDKFLEGLGDVGHINWNTVIGFLETTYRGAVDIHSLMKSQGLPTSLLLSLQGYTYTSDLLKTVRKSLDLDLLVLFLDDAAHALDTRAQGAFFTAIKSLYDSGLAFKISVYPAVTRYGIDFGYGHDAIVISLGNPPRANNIDAFLDMLSKRRQVADENSRALLDVLLLNTEWPKLLAYCANGNPRGLFKLVAQIQTQLGSRAPTELRFEDIRIAITTVIDKHLENMVPGVIKDIDPRLLKAAEYLQQEFRLKISDKPGPFESGKPRGYLAITNSMQVPYLCQAALKLLVAANVVTPEGPTRLSKRETGTLYSLHPGFIFRDNVIGGIAKGTLTATDWLDFFSGLSSRVHAEITKSAELWQEIVSDIASEPLFECPNGHPLSSPSARCDVCGKYGIEISPVQILLDKDIQVLDLSDAIKERMRTCKFSTVRQVFEASNAELDGIDYIGEKRILQIRSAVSMAVDEFMSG